jgi:hypothetical protein
MLSYLTGDTMYVSEMLSDLTGDTMYVSEMLSYLIDNAMCQKCYLIASPVR